VPETKGVELEEMEHHHTTNTTESSTNANNTASPNANVDSSRSPKPNRNRKSSPKPPVYYQNPNKRPLSPNPNPHLTSSTSLPNNNNNNNVNNNCSPVPVAKPKPPPNLHLNFRKTSSNQNPPRYAEHSRNEHRQPTMMRHSVSINHPTPYNKDRTDGGNKKYHRFSSYYDYQDRGKGLVSFNKDEKEPFLSSYNESNCNTDNLHGVGSTTTYSNYPYYYQPQESHNPVQDYEARYNNYSSTSSGLLMEGKEYTRSLVPRRPRQPTLYYNEDEEKDYHHQFRNPGQTNPHPRLYSSLREPRRLLDENDHLEQRVHRHYRTMSDYYGCDSFWDEGGVTNQQPSNGPPQFYGGYVPRRGTVV